MINHLLLAVSVSTPKVNLAMAGVAAILALPVMWFINKMKGFLPTIFAGIGFLAFILFVAHLH